MEYLYFGIILFLFTLAIFDLIVGVSNDAVNFMNSAIGSKTAKMKTIMIIAALGVFIGASMSNGMMDIARHGIFKPEYFYFSEIMIILLAVMVTDIVLLDTFNSLGLPTSTTVSLVFELLGGTVAIALIKSLTEDTGANFGEMINSGKALTVIMGIFISVAIAFVFGAIIQWISRLLFTFNYKKNLKYFAGIFGGISLTSIVYFMLLKGLKGTTFIDAETLAWINANTATILISCFVGFGVLSQLLHLMKVNIFKIIVLVGTFSLAMAFAGNDLVNFIGVPLAGLDAYKDFTANGIAAGADHYLMGYLNTSAKTPVIFLVLAGLVMVITLFTSKKAKNVTKTEVSLAKNEDGNEMFGSSATARNLTHNCMKLSQFILKVTPDPVKRWVDSRFNKDESILAEGAAFDQLRASVNLVVAALLVALGTSLKLPLSTTFVTFMVAMGSSLADRAWSRESAVFRVTGVISVIGGWFITAGAAFLACFLVALIMYYGGIAAMAAMCIIAIILIIRSNIRFRKKLQEEKEDTLMNKILSEKDKTKIWPLLKKHILENIYKETQFVKDEYCKLTDAFMYSDLKTMRKVHPKLSLEKKIYKLTRRQELVGLRRCDEITAIKSGTWFHLCSNNTLQLIYTLIRISEPCKEHIENNFNPLPENCVKEYKALRDELIALTENDCLDFIEKCLNDELFEDEKQARSLEILARISAFKKNVNTVAENHLKRIHEEKNGSNVNIYILYHTVLQESYQLADILKHLIRAVKGLSKQEEQ